MRFRNEDDEDHGINNHFVPVRLVVKESESSLVPNCYSVSECQIQNYYYLSASTIYYVLIASTSPYKCEYSRIKKKF